MTPTPWLRVADAAAYAGLHKAQIFRACAQRSLEHVRVGGRGTIVTRAEWIDRWLDSMTVHVAPDRGGR